MVTQAQGSALVIGNLKGRCEVVRALQATQFQIIEATECLGGMQLIRDLRPNVVIVAAVGPSSNVAKSLRAVRCLTSAPVILVGACGSPSGNLSLPDGADAYLPLRFDIESLLTYVHVFLSRN